MAKTKEQIKTEGRAVFYAVLWPSLKKAAIECGWALALHGSMESDMDLMAMPWVEDCKPVEEMIKTLSDCLGNTVWKDHHIKPHYGKPHGRVVYSLSICADWYLDVSCMPPFT